jgi:hypothetical protein
VKDIALNEQPRSAKDKSAPSTTSGKVDRIPWKPTRSRANPYVRPIPTNPVFCPQNKECPQVPRSALAGTGLRKSLFVAGAHPMPSANQIACSPAECLGVNWRQF